MTHIKRRKRRPHPPKWWDTDECWACKNHSGCGGCRFLKNVVAAQRKKRKKNGTDN